MLFLHQPRLGLLHIFPALESFRQLKGLVATQPSYDSSALLVIVSLSLNIHQNSLPEKNFCANVQMLRNDLFQMTVLVLLPPWPQQAIANSKRLTGFHE